MNEGTVKIKKSGFHIFLWFSGAFIAFIALIVLFYWQTNLVSEALEKYLNGALAEQGEVRYSSIGGNIVNEFVIHDLKLHFKNGDRYSAEKIHLKYSLLPLFGGELKIESLAAEKLKVILSKSDDSSSAEYPERAPFAFINDIKPAEILKNIPEFNIADLRVVDGYLAFEGPHTAFSSINLKIAGKKDLNGLFVSAARLSGRWREKNIDFRKIVFDGAITGDEISIDSLLLKTKKSFIKLSLKLKKNERPRIFCAVDKFMFNTEEWGAAVFNESKKAGNIGGAIKLNADTLAADFDGKFYGSISGFPFDDLSVQASADSEKVRINRLELLSGVQHLAFSGYYDFSRHIKGRFSFKQLNLQTLAKDGIYSELNGSADADIRFTDQNSAEGGLNFDIFSSKADRLPIDSLHFSALFSNGVYKIVEPSFLLISKGSRFDVSGTVKDTLVSLNLKTAHNDLGVLAGALGVDSLAGIFNGELKLRGRLFNPDIEANIDMPIFSYSNKIHFDSTVFKARVRQIFTKRDGAASFIINNGNVYGFPIDDISFKARMDENIYSFPYLGFHSGDNFIRSKLHFVVKEDSVLFFADKFKGSYQKYWLENRDPVRGYLTSDDIILQNLHLVGPNNSSLYASGDYHKKNGEAEIYLSLENISLQPFENFWDKKFSLSGLVNGSADIINPQKNLELNMNLKVDSLVYNKVPIGNINSSFVYYNRNFYLNELRFHHRRSELSVEGDLAFSFDSTKQMDALLQSKTNVKVNWDGINIGQYAPLFMGKEKLEGSTSGYFELHGTVTNPMIRNHVALYDVKYKNLYLNELELFAQYNRGYLILDSLGLNINGTDFSAAGWQSYHLDFRQIDTSFADKPFNLFVRSSGDTLDLLKEFNEQLYGIYGKYDMELNLGGTPARPSVESGHIYLKDGEILLSQVLDPIDNVQIAMEIDSSLLEIKRFEGHSSAPKDILEKGWYWLIGKLPWLEEKDGEGMISAAGNIDLHNLLMPRYDINIDMNNFYINNYLNNTKIVLNSSDLSIRGKDTLHIAGTVEISDGEYIVDMDQMEKNIYLSSPETAQTYPLIDEDIKISIPNDFIISSASMDLTNNFKIAINGDLHIIKPAGEDNLQMSGLIETTSGKYAAWNQTFEINSGEILFDTPNTINPLISIMATKVIKDQTFYLTISGRLDELQQTIRVTKDGRELNLSDSDKLSMLTFGTDLSGLSSNADSTMSSMGGDIATRALLNVVERGAENLTGLDKISVNTGGSLVDFQKMKLNNGLKDASISFGKYITGDLYLEYRTSFSENFPAPTIGWQAGNRIFLEYRLYKRLKIDSFYEATQAGKMKIQLGVSWEYDF